MKIKYKSVSRKVPIVVELSDDIENAEKIKKAIIKFRAKNVVEGRRRKRAIELAEQGDVPCAKKRTEYSGWNSRLGRSSHEPTNVALGA